MLDLHCHILPGIDDGATDLPMALQMARMAVDDGITTIACTPHIYPGLYENTAAGIARAVACLQREFDDAGLALKLLSGADVHLEPNLGDGIRDGRIPTIAGSRYLLLEPPHHVAPPRFEDTVFDLVVQGYVPVITHPERLSWIEDHYEIFKRLSVSGAWMQITAGSVTGRFGKRPRYWAERMLDEGLVHILATDAHHPRRRPPLLAEARDAVATRLGAAEAEAMVVTRPRAIVEDAPVSAQPPLPGPRPMESKRRGWWRNLFGKA